MMNRQQYLLTKMAEEASEISQIALKAQQFGFDSVQPGQVFTNKERIQQELNDLVAIFDLLNHEFNCGFSAISEESIAAQDLKVEKVNRYYDYSQKLGMVE